MIQRLTQAEQARDVTALADVQELLEIETETWRLVQQNFAEARGTAVKPPLAPGPLWNAAAGSDGSLCVDA